VSTPQILALGAIAGVTILLGLPAGRVQAADLRLRAGLSAMATGILLFLLWDVLSHAVEPVEESLTASADGVAGWGRFIWLVTLLAGGVALSLMSLVYYDQWLTRRRSQRGHSSARLSEGAQLAVLIASGIGLHNFAEGLAIGQSAASGETSLAIVLVVGFALHNATEGFGIVAPMSGESPAPSWLFLLFLGAIGGAPTFFGTLIGQAWTSDALSVAFLALAGGSILYVLLELLHVNRGFGMKPLVTWALLGGLVLGFGTDFVLAAVGG
jgi:zinc transporter, ZIP family